MANGEMVGSSAVLRRAWSRSQRGAEARMRAERKKKVSLNVAMESASLTSAPSHATVDIRAAAAACGQATAASAVA
jgi:hypothetical protein